MRHLILVIVVVAVAGCATNGPQDPQSAELQSAATDVPATVSPGPETPVERVPAADTPWLLEALMQQSTTAMFGSPPTGGGGAVDGCAQFEVNIPRNVTRLAFAIHANESAGGFGEFDMSVLSPGDGEEYRGREYAVESPAPGNWNVFVWASGVAVDREYELRGTMEGVGAPPRAFEFQPIGVEPCRD